MKNPLLSLIAILPILGAPVSAYQAQTSVNQVKDGSNNFGRQMRYFDASRGGPNECRTLFFQFNREFSGIARAKGWAGVIGNNPHWNDGNNSIDIVFNRSGDLSRFDEDKIANKFIETCFHSDDVTEVNIMIANSGYINSYRAMSYSKDSWGIENAQCTERQGRTYAPPVNWNQQYCL